MIIRAASAADAQGLAGVHAAAFETPWDAATIGSLLAAPQVLAFVADEESAGAGFILLRIAADEAEILTLATREDQRRRGIALALLGAAMEAAAAAGAASLFLEVASDNAPARALYLKAEFTPVGARRGYYARPDGAVDALILRRDLNR
jgi:[ribosomal protein S18]-alanine N-acetyltransferase